MATKLDEALREKLASVLPQNKAFHIHHLSTPPTSCEALYSAPPNERPDRTYRENHFLTASIDTPKGSRVCVLGLEVLIFTTKYSTTIFVSKADSTGYLNLLDLPKGTPSPIREITVAFVEHLVESRKREGVQLIVSLFARSQDQYLFPGSIKNKGKHVLSDRNLIKWWCRVLNPLLDGTKLSESGKAKGYLIVPGLDHVETKMLVPASTASTKWSLNAHPLQEISHYTQEFDWVPARCLIPHFPDDPKTRFQLELDDEAEGTKEMKRLGRWKSVKSLDLFWEMMAWRQECSSGRMTGFIWIVFDNAATQTPNNTTSISSETKSTAPRRIVPLTQKEKEERDAFNKKSKKKSSKDKKSKKLRGYIIPRKPRIKTPEQQSSLAKTPIHSDYYYWPPAGRGECLLADKDYDRTVELLLHLDFANVDKAANSSKRWHSEAGRGGDWGWSVVGTRVVEEKKKDDGEKAVGSMNNLSGLVKRKRGGDDDAGEKKVNVLGAGLIKRKAPEST